MGNNVPKCVAMPTISAAISCTGPTKIGPYFSFRLSYEFQSFDDLVLRGDEILPELFEEFSSVERDGDVLSSLYLIGWHEDEARPAAYSMDMWTDDSSRIEQVIENSSNCVGRQRFKFSEQLLGGTPIPGANLIAAAGLKIPDDVNDMNPEIDLLHLMEIQRHEKIEGHYWVGGKALLTSIDRSGITQRVVHHWKEDRIGEVITPQPIDWIKWRAEREANSPTAIAVPAGMNRHERRRASRRLVDVPGFAGVPMGDK